MNWPKQPHKDYVIERCRMPFKLLYVCLQASKQANNSNNIEKNATASKEKTKVKKLAASKNKQANCLWTDPSSPTKIMSLNDAACRLNAVCTPASKQTSKQANNSNDVGKNATTSKNKSNTTWHVQSTTMSGHNLSTFKWEGRNSNFVIHPRGEEYKFEFIPTWHIRWHISRACCHDISDDISAWHVAWHIRWHISNAQPRQRNRRQYS